MNNDKPTPKGPWKKMSLPDRRDRPRPPKPPKAWSHHDTLAELKGKKITVFLREPLDAGDELLNSVVGDLIDYDQFSMLLRSPQTNVVIFKHSIATFCVTPPELEGA